MSSGAMDCESSSVYIEPVYAAEFSVEASAGYDSEGSNDSSEFVDDVSYDCAEPFDESANQIDDCIDNLISDTVVEDLETIVMVCKDDTLEEDEISISPQILADFAASELENVEMESSSEVVFTLEQQLRIKNWSDEVKKEEEKLVQASELECIDMHSSSEVVFTFEQQLRFNTWSDAMEKEAFERCHAIFLAENELSITQYTGYGVYHADQLIPQEIQGLEPKLPGMHKIWEWMFNEANHFEISFYADLMLSEK